MCLLSQFRTSRSGVCKDYRSVSRSQFCVTIAIGPVPDFVRNRSNPDIITLFHTYTFNLLLNLSSLFIFDLRYDSLYQLLQRNYSCLGPNHTNQSKF